MSQGHVFNIVRYAVHDGPGIRVTFFLRGCPLRCWWCHNPECYARLPESESSTPSHALSPFSERLMTPAEVVAEIEKDIMFLDESGGGATFSGGEPLVQAPFLLEVLALCRRREIHTALDTTGYASPETLEAAAGLADLFLYDLKLIDDDAHRRYTGVSNALIHENLARLARRGSRVLIRFPLIPFITDTEANVSALARLLDPLPGLRKIHLLPYHKIAAGKYRRLDLEDRLRGLEPPTPERIQEVQTFLSQRGFEVQIGG